MQFSLLDKIRQANPLIHCITNYVVANYTANGLLALGASPLMSANVQEMSDIQHFSKGLLLNIGTLNHSDLDAMICAGRAANALNVPVVLDPVGVGATPYRQQAIAHLLQTVKMSVIRGNVGEIATLAEIDWQAKGVDAGQGQADFAAMTQAVAQKYHCIVAMSGEIDRISDGNRVVNIHNGTPLFTRITGAGCLLGAVFAAFLSVADQDQAFQATIEACTSYNIAGELATQGILPQQSGKFAVQLLDCLATLRPTDISTRARVSDE
ncbi:hydroxyethylthiazole kinase [Muribacter muris]|uniref:Hydroxyethylthiazole kinase n=1 Tax=Muribacter muris TaxID=67855 RepID=A0A4Y9JSJ3_9PAST|nr:hydroxyethylthiazole kinase [Muribacter muris]MBF0785716.1 hydroxyethylthiazole kinase [Muribacter muris]MBF0827751.1 hydroxyethylthiazole kinase [Muribacter muris]TFV08793.1 hydroxyethylthiazole kinase [Muribacter muris]